MTRAGNQALAPIRSLLRYPPRNAADFVGRFRNLPRPGYCLCCNAWSWRTNETPAYSAYDGAWLCDDCADDNDEETRRAWAEYYSGCL